MDNLTFGAKLAQHRDASGLSLSDIAKKCGVAKSYIWELEKGSCKHPSLWVALKIANSFGYTISEFLGEEKAAVYNGEEIRKLAIQIQELTKWTSPPTTPNPQPY